MSCILGEGWKTNCAVSGGVDTAWLANFVSGNKYVSDAGDATGTYTAVADNGSGTILVTATNGSVGHNLVQCQLVNLIGVSGDYDGRYEVLTVPTASTFTVKATFTATDTGTWSYDTEILIGTATTGGTPLTFFEIEQDLEKAEGVENEVKENGSTVYEQMVTIEIYASKDQTIEDARIQLVDQIGSGKFVGIAKDNNGVYKVYGAKNGLEYSEGDGGPGQAYSDLNGNILTLKAKEPEPAYLYDLTGDDSGTPAEPFDPFVFTV